MYDIGSAECHAMDSSEWWIRWSHQTCPNHVCTHLQHHVCVHHVCTHIMYCNTCTWLYICMSQIEAIIVTVGKQLVLYNSYYSSVTNPVIRLVECNVIKSLTYNLQYLQLTTYNFRYWLLYLKLPQGSIALPLHGLHVAGISCTCSLRWNFQTLILIFIVLALYHQLRYLSASS